VIDAINNDKLNLTFPVVKTSTRLFGHYLSFDTLTPAQCFNSCKLNASCGGASFTTDRKWAHNCFLCHRYNFTQSSVVYDPAVSAELWTSYIEAGWTPDVQPLIAANFFVNYQSKDVFEKTWLIGRVFAKFNTSYASECFEKCDAIAECAAASSMRFQCELLKYGFQEIKCDDCISYLKPEVSYEIANIHSYINELPMQVYTRFTNAYEGLDTVTPLICFRRCNESVDCAAASFTVYIQSPQNCYFHKKGMYGQSEEDLEYWVSFVKKVQPSSLDVLVAATAIAEGLQTTKARESF
jgi:hypothetical protein